jgi:hypothetical protein
MVTPFIIAPIRKNSAAYPASPAPLVRQQQNAQRRYHSHHGYHLQKPQFSTAIPQPALQYVRGKRPDRLRTQQETQTPAEARRALEQSVGSAHDALAQPETDDYQPRRLSL